MSLALEALIQYATRTPKVQACSIGWKGWHAWFRNGGAMTDDEDS
jgi:hypothetical protein